MSELPLYPDFSEPAPHAPAGLLGQSVLIKLADGAPEELLPAYATAGAAAMDVRAWLPNGAFHLRAGGRWTFRTGIHLEMPIHLEAQLRARSSQAKLFGVIALPYPQATIDSDYRGEISVVLLNTGGEDYKVEPCQRIAQMVFAPVARVSLRLVTELTPTARGEGGFGSTGK